MKTFCTFFLLLFIAGYVCAQDGIYFLNKTGRKVLIQKRTILEDGAFPHIIDTNSQVFQSIPLQINSPTILNVTSIPPKGPYGSADGIYFLFKSGDSLVITLDNLKKPVFEHLTNLERTKELTFFKSLSAKLKIPLPYQLFGSAGNQMLNRKIWSDNLKVRDKILDSLYRPFIQSVKSDEGISINPDAEKWYYFYLGSLVSDKLFLERNIDSKLQYALNSFYKDSLTKWRQLLNCEGCENIPPYNYALYATYRISFIDLTPPQFIDTVSILATGSNKDFVLSKYVNRNGNQFMKDEQLLSSYETLCADSIYRNKVIENYTLQKIQSAGFTNEVAVLTKADKSEIGFKKLIEQQKGNVVYVDFWASWCKPCIEELPYSHQLREKVMDKEIKFLYISLDDDFDSWNQAVSKYKITTAQSFMMPAADKTALAKQIALGPIPRYLVIDRNGKIVSLDAPRPSDEETLPLLIKTLNTKE